MGLLYRFRFHGHVLELPEVPFKRGLGLCPQCPEDLEPFNESPHTALARSAENGLGYVRTANADADSEPTLT